MLKTVSEAIEYRRSVRKYLDAELDEEKVKNCIRNATLAPNSSNMQLWEFYHVTDNETLKKLSKACFDQNAAKTAINMVVFVARRDKWRERAKYNLDFLEDMFDKQEKKGIDVSRRRKVSRRYYKKLMPTIYTRETLVIPIILETLTKKGVEFIIEPYIRFVAYLILGIIILQQSI